MKQSDEAHGVGRAHMPKAYWIVNADGRRPYSPVEGACIAATESSTSILERAGAVDTGRCADYKIVPYWNGGFMDLARETLNGQIAVRSVTAVL